MRILFILVLFSLQGIAQELKSYQVSPQFIRFLVENTPYSLQKTNGYTANDDPFADDCSTQNAHYNLSEFQKEVLPNPAELYLTKIKAPQLVNYFSPSDRVYDARKLFNKLSVQTGNGGWILYNASKKQLHCYKLVNSNLQKLADAYDRHLTSQLYTSITLNQSKHQQNQSIYHLPQLETALSIGGYKLSLTSQFTKDKSIHSSYSLSSEKWKVPLTGSIDNKGKYEIKIDEETTLKIVTLEIKLARDPALVALNPLPDPIEIEEPDITAEVPVLEFFEVDRYLLEFLMYIDHPSTNDPFAPDYNSIEIVQSNYHLLSKMSPVEPPVIEGISFKEDLCIDLSEFLGESERLWGESCWAVFNYTQGKIISYNTPTQLDILEQLTAFGCCHNPANIIIEAVLVELPAREAAYSYTEIIQSDYHILSSMDVTCRSGEKATVSEIKPDGERTPYFCEMEPSLGEDGKHIDIRIIIETPKLKHTTGTTLFSGHPIALPLKKNTTTATYLLLKSTISRLAHSH